MPKPSWKTNGRNWRARRNVELPLVLAGTAALQHALNMEPEDIRWKQRFVNGRKAFELGLVSDGEVWMGALENRNRTSHTCNEKSAQELLDYIRSASVPLFRELFELQEARP